MIDITDRRPATSGFSLTIATGERVHVWPDVDLMVVERPRQAVSTGLPTPRLAQLKLTVDTDVHSVARLVSWVIAQWRRPR